MKCDSSLYLLNILAWYPLDAVKVETEAAGSLLHFTELGLQVLCRGRVLALNWGQLLSTECCYWLHPPHFFPVKKRRHTSLWNDFVLVSVTNQGLVDHDNPHPLRLLKRSTKGKYPPHQVVNVGLVLGVMV